MLFSVLLNNRDTHFYMEKPSFNHCTYNSRYYHLIFNLSPVLKKHYILYNEKYNIGLPVNLNNKINNIIFIFMWSKLFEFRQS